MIKKSFFFKENWFKLTIIIILIFILSFHFYWNEIRTSRIKHECYNIAINHSGTQKIISESYERIFNFYYNSCLKNLGY